MTISLGSEEHGLQQIRKLTEVSRALTYAVSLLEGIWKGDSWWAHTHDLAALVVAFALCTALSAKIFRWE